MMETSTRTSFPAPRRVMTAPVARTADLPSSSSTNGLVETLYNHPNARIIAFSAQGRGRARSPGRAQPDEEPGSLAWSSGLERTIAVGPFRIYRAPGSVAFLNCGSALQPILPKSQCWCIDEVSSKFVLQIRRPNYWRIEVPIESPHEQDLAQALRVVLDQILQFEKTPCPFKRAFTVQLPERPSTPVVKKPWMPVYGPLPPLSTPEFSTSPTPTPKSLRSAEKKSLARRSSAGWERTLLKESSDSEDNGSRTRSESTSRPAEAETEIEPEASVASPFDDDRTEEARGRTLAREEVDVAAPQPEPSISTAEDVAPDVKVAPEAETSVLENVSHTDADEALESPLEGIDEVSEDLPLEAPIEKIKEEPEEVVLEAITEDVEVLPSETITEFEEPWSAHSVDTPKDMEPAQSPLEEEPWSAHSMDTFLISEVTEPKDEGITGESGVPPVEEDLKGETSVVEKGEVGDSDANHLVAKDDTSKASSVPVAEVASSPSMTEKTARTESARATEDISKLDDDRPSSLNDHRSDEQPEPRALATATKRLSLISDKFDGIRPYDQKSAAGTLTSLDVASRVTFETPPDLAPEEDKKSHSSSDELSLSSSQEEALTAGPSEAETHEGSGTIGARRKKKLRAFHGSRSLAVPPQLTLVTSPPSKSAASKRSPTQQPEQSTESSSPTGSQDSFHSVQSWHSPITPLPPSPPASDPTTPSTFPYPHNNILMPKRVSRYEMSDLTVTPETRRTWDVASSGTQDSSQESAATAPDVVIGEYPDKLDEPEATSTAPAPKRSEARHRATTSTMSRRALSPLPPAANLFSPTSATSRRRPNRSPLELVRRVPMAIVAKTCEILLSPPSHLINLMLRVAAKIAAGEWRGMVFGYGEGGEAIPVQWDYSDGELSGDDDEYYLRPSESARAGGDRSVSHSGTGRGWEVD